MRMREFIFSGTVRSNSGRFHKEMIVPGRGGLPAPPQDWPKELAPGTLHIEISADGWPAALSDCGTGDGLMKFDQGGVRPEFTIQQQEIAGNTLKPKPEQPLRDPAQVWRAELTVLTIGKTTRCWMLRRIGSRIASQIELVADRHLGTSLSLEDGTDVRITLYEG